MSINSLNQHFPAAPIEPSSSPTTHTIPSAEKRDEMPSSNNRASQGPQHTRSAQYNQKKLIGQLNQSANKFNEIATLAVPLAKMLPDRSGKNSNKTEGSPHNIKETVHKVADFTGKVADGAAALAPLVALAGAACPPLKSLLRDWEPPRLLVKGQKHWQLQPRHKMTKQ